MRGVILVLAGFIGLMLDISSVSAQNPYGIGGYLDRPYDLGEESDAEQARRSRRRPSAAEPQAQQQQQQPQAPQQGPGQAAAVAPQQQPESQPSPSSQQQGAPRRPAYTQPGQQQPGATSRQQQQQQQSTQRPRPAAEPSRPRLTPPPQEAAQREREREAVHTDSEAVLPPLPLRRPEFIEPPVNSVAALATPGDASIAADRLPPASAAAAEEQPAPAPPSASPEPVEDIASPEAGTASAERPDAAPAEGQAVPGPTPPATVAEAPSSVAPMADAPGAGQSAAAQQTTPQPAPDTGSPAPPIAPAPTVAEAAPVTPPTAAPAPVVETPPAQPQIAQSAPSQEPAAPSIQQAVAEPAAPTPAEAPKTEAPAPTQTAALEPAPRPLAAAEPTPQPAAQAELPAEPAPSAQNVAEPPVQAGPTSPSVPAAPPVEIGAASAPGNALAVPTPAEASPERTAASVPLPVQMARAAEDKTTVPQPQLRDTAQLDRMIGQMLLVGFRGLTPDEAWPQKLAAQIKAGTIGGVLFMSHNVQSPTQLKALTSYLQRVKTDIPLLLAVDQEGGIVQRLSADKGFQTYPTASKIGQSNDPLTAYSIYGRLATELTRFGFNVNLGPVVDLQRNDNSPIIAGKERSFGALPKHVTAFAKAFMMAHQEAGVLTVLKHFPGHGSTPFDTHTQPVNLGSEWDQVELEPYDELIKSRVAQAVMVGHIANPAMSEEPGLPASLSARTIQEVLRRALGFTGVVISDDLEMGAIRARYTLEESAVKALKAGNDMIILSNQNTPSPDLPERIVAAVRKAVESGEISREALQASYDRIIGLKQQLPPGAAARSGGVSKRAASAERGKAAPAAAAR